MNKGVIDIGNTQNKFAVLNHKGQLIAQKTFNALEKGLEWLTRHQVDAIMASSVSKDIPNRYNGIRIYKVSSASKLNFKNLYQSKTLGSDRICAVAAAVHLFPKTPVLIFDIGSCLTIDFVNANAEFSGGNISPGLNMRLKAMHLLTHKLPLVKSNIAILSLANSTQSAIANGALQGMQHEMIGYIETYRSQFKDLKIVICGGDASHFVFPAKYKIFVHEYLVLQGLYALLKLNETL